MCALLSIRVSSIEVRIEVFEYRYASDKWLSVYNRDDYLRVYRLIETEGHHTVRRH